MDMNRLSAKLILFALITSWSVGASQAEENPDAKVVQAARKEGEIVWYTTMSL